MANFPEHRLFSERFQSFSNRDKLNILLGYAEAPITGRKVGAVLETEDGIQTYGFNIENKRGILHAEVVAAAGIKSKKFKSINLIASGDPLAIKNCIPCEACTTSLSPQASEAAVVSLSSQDGKLTAAFPFRDLEKSYRGFQDVPHAGSDIETFLEQRTRLTEVDRVVISNFSNNVKELAPNAEVYLTGSASERGGPSSMVAQLALGSPYLDLDMITIFPELPQNVTDRIGDIYLEALRDVGFNYNQVQLEEVPTYKLEAHEASERFSYRTVYWVDDSLQNVHAPNWTKNADVPSTMDVSVGESLESVMTKRYLEKNWYLKLV
jgi:cytidine deaminase